MLKRSAILLAGLVLSTASGDAADLDAFRAPPPVVEGVGPPPRFAGPRPPSSPCHVIAEPQFNLSQDDVVRSRPQVVCLSRGLYSDSFN